MGFALDGAVGRAGMKSFRLGSTHPDNPNTIFFKGGEATARLGRKDSSPGKSVVTEVHIIPSDRNDPQSARTVTATLPGGVHVGFDVVSDKVWRSSGTDDTHTAEAVPPDFYGALREAVAAVTALAQSYIDGNRNTEATAMTPAELAAGKLGAVVSSATDWQKPLP